MYRRCGFPNAESPFLYFIGFIKYKVKYLYNTKNFTNAGSCDIIKCDKSEYIGGEHDVGITESEIFRTKGTSSGFGMV
jgi:hypothetical protein